jgi:ABC-type glycerol-3-phosphate transport system permease component
MLVFLTFFPVVFMFITSFKNNTDYAINFWGLPGIFRIENFGRAWDAIHAYIWNSIIVCVAVVAGVIVLACICAYVFSRFSFPGKEMLYYAILSLMMIPGILTLIPSFIVVRELGLLNSHLALILPALGGGQVFCIFVLRSFFATIPQELFDAARMDGASELRVLWSIVIPLSKHIIGTVAILNVLGTWNSYIWPLITLRDENLRTIPIGIAFLSTEYRIQIGETMAANVLASIPMLVLFAFTMKYFIRGLSSGAIKA